MSSILSLVAKEDWWLSLNVVSEIRTGFLLFIIKILSVVIGAPSGDGGRSLVDSPEAPCNTVFLLRNISAEKNFANPYHLMHFMLTRVLLSMAA